MHDAINPDTIMDLEPLEDLTATGASVPVDSVLTLPAVSALVQTFSYNTIQTVILDRHFLLIWANRAYRDFFETDGDTGSVSFFSLFRGSHDERELAEICRALRTESARYSWSGRLMRRRTGKRTVIDLAQIIPIFTRPAPGTEPDAYVVFLNDITEEFRTVNRTTFQSLLEASILKDKNTGKHVERVNHYARLTAETLYRQGTDPTIDPDFIEDIGFLAAMHDVGKIGTPDDILNKDGKLEPWEWEVMKEHTINGAYILSTYPNPMARDIALFHHERWDGTGYPYGLAGPMIPIAARIVTVADVYDALRSPRSYKKALSHPEAREILTASRGTQFDPTLVTLFLELELRFEEIYSRLADE